MVAKEEVLIFGKYEDLASKVIKFCLDHDIDEGWQLAVPVKRNSKILLLASDDDEPKVDRQLYLDSTLLSVDAIKKRFSHLFPNSEGFTIDNIIEIDNSPHEEEKTIIVSVSRPFIKKNIVSSKIK